MEAFVESTGNISLEFESSFADVTTVKSESNYEEQDYVDAEIVEEWSEVDIKLEDINMDDIKEEPAEISICKAEVPCSNCCHKLDEGLFLLLNNGGATTTNDLCRTVPKNFFEINRNVSALRYIPENVIFGPYAGLQSQPDSNDQIHNIRLYNWLQCIPFSTDKLRCNVSVFQFNHLLYFRTIRNIACKEQLVAHLDQQLVKEFSNDPGKYYYPAKETIPHVYACIPCCLGFKSERYLQKHVKNCVNNKKKFVGDLVQCKRCELIYYDREHHKNHREKNCVSNKRFITAKNKEKYISNTQYIEANDSRIFDPEYCNVYTRSATKETKQWVYNRSLSVDTLPMEEMPENESKHVFHLDSITSDSDDSEYKPGSSTFVVSSSGSESSYGEHNILKGRTDLQDIDQANTYIAIQITPPKRKRDRNFCYFCESPVSNFARHILRNHHCEIETQNILAEPVGSKKRKQLLEKLRKKGNYLDKSEGGKPMRRHKYTKYLPCTDCFGFYSAKNLWKHRKHCSKNPTRKSTQVDAQNFLVRNVKIDPHLRNIVFPRMRADQISLVAKKDFLICAYAARYIKSHRKKHFVNVASRRMREIAKIVIEMQNVVPSIKNLFDCLRPQYYDNLVAATRKVAKYDNANENYRTPSLALNMGTSLKQCCDVARLHILKRNNIAQTVATDSLEADIKTISDLIEGHWRFDISSQMFQDLNVKKWNKVTIVPLASDLKLLKEYLIKIANQSADALQKNCSDQKAYINLLETIYCRVVLLNRKRLGELQKFPLKMYEASLSGKSEYEEFSEAVTETERILINNFKKIVIRGERGRDVLVLFTKDVQDHLQILLNHRDGIIKKPNQWLFGDPNTSEPITGYKVLDKYAHACGAKNPSSITCTRLRKHLATLTQLFDMSENDIKQLASYMGHALSVHRSSYRLPDDIYQTVKIFKLLLLMEKGEAGQLKGKRLDEINFDLEKDLMQTGTNIEDDVEERLEEKVDENIVEQGKRSEEESEKSPFTVKKNRKRVLVHWTNEQKKVVCDFFKGHIAKKQPPKKAECEKLHKLHPLLFANKDWPKIKVFIQNKYRKGQVFR